MGGAGGGFVPLGRFSKGLPPRPGRRWELWKESHSSAMRKQQDAPSSKWVLPLPGGAKRGE